MNITEYILKDFKPLGLQSSIGKAQELCEELPISHIPIVENDKLIGCFSQTDIQTIEDPSLKVEDFTAIFYHFHSTKSTTILELINVFANNDANITPIIMDNNYIGYFELSDILGVFSSSPFIASDGFILQVQKNTKEYTMSEISQIVESNDGVLLGAYQSEKVGDTIIITLKISSQEINDIIQTFRRYNYTIITEHSDDFYLEELKSRADYLQKFLNT